MRIKLSLLTLPTLGFTLVLLLGACTGVQGGGSGAQSSGTPVHPFTDPGGADTPTAASTGAQPRRY